MVGTVSRAEHLHGSGRHVGFRGWWMVLWCTVVGGATAPGQTIGVSAFIDSFIEDLDVSRSTVSTAYLVGTLSGAAALPAIGRWVDRVGVRHAMTVVGALFAVVVALTGIAQNIVMLAAAFVGLRMLGQGALSLISSTGVTLWFERRRGLALAIRATLAMGLLSLAPLGFGALIDGFGWRQAWLILGIGVAIIVLPIARLGITDRPEHIDQLPDGDTPEQVARRPVRRSATVRQALRTPAFWTLGVLTALMGALITGLTFHNEDIMGAQGLSTEQAAAIFLPQMLGSVVIGFLFGWLSDRMAPRWLLFASGLFLTAGVFAATLASPGAAALAYGLLSGASIGSLSALGGALYPKWFGIDNVAAIKGVATTLNVAGSAVGPLLLSVGNDISGSYEPIITLSAAVCLVAALVTLAVPTPRVEHLP